MANTTLIIAIDTNGDRRTVEFAGGPAAAIGGPAAAIKHFGGLLRCDGFRPIRLVLIHGTTVMQYEGAAEVAEVLGW